MTGNSALVSSLESAIDLLKKCHLSKKAEWFSERLERIEHDPSIEVLTEVAEEVRAVIGGMGSFTDLSLQPSSESGMSEMEAQEVQWRLADALDSATSNIMRHGKG